MKRNLIPLFLMLLAGAITSMFSYFNKYELKRMLITLLITMFVFYIIGLIVKAIMDSMAMKIKADKMEELEEATDDKADLNESTEIKE